MVDDMTAIDDCRKCKGGSKFCWWHVYNEEVLTKTPILAKGGDMAVVKRDG